MDRRRTGAVTKHTCLVIIELAMVAANYITEAEESGKGKRERIYGRWAVVGRSHKGVISTE